MISKMTNIQLIPVLFDKLHKCVAMFLRKKVAVGLIVREYIWICVLDYSSSNSKVRFRDLSGLSPLVKIS